MAKANVCMSVSVPVDAEILLKATGEAAAQVEAQLRATLETAIKASLKVVAGASASIGTPAVEIGPAHVSAP